MTQGGQSVRQSVIVYLGEAVGTVGSEGGVLSARHLPTKLAEHAHLVMKKGCEGWTKVRYISQK